MYSIDVTLKYSPIAVSVQRKDREDAEALYQKVVAAMGGTPQAIELTCEKEPEKKVSLFSDQISAVIISQRSGAAASGRPTGFFVGVE
ncbi:hypothetical protein [Oscillatoria sp. FACHB-1406]|uniref:hypothetical protein n=1 Tax=Oscillatoria sp. FACHB-1406 TaxID=2692846 RepID=UPI001681D526|nr:hypothetical protein [Oscillatoria sp. FACHB-1406]MBD2579730.1 hypothetical protein [Oscillatoria sp. FACHB-1406]